jgi:hypothetical protein
MPWPMVLVHENLFVFFVAMSFRTGRGSVFHGLGRLTIHASAEFINAVLAVNAMANPAFGHDVFRFTLEFFLARLTHKYRIGHFTPPALGSNVFVSPFPGPPPRLSGAGEPARHSS